VARCREGEAGLPALGELALDPDRELRDAEAKKDAILC
jgi:hypothetical protein